MVAHIVFQREPIRSERPVPHGTKAPGTLDILRRQRPFFKSHGDIEGEQLMHRHLVDVGGDMVIEVC